MILEVVKKAEARAAYDVARRIKQTCGQIFRYGVATGRAERDPTHDIRDAMRPYKMEHFAALDIKDLPEFLHVLDRNEMRLYKQTQMAMRFLMFTFVRALMRMGYKDKMTGHGFRALAMTTIKEKLDYRHEVVDRQLAHARANKIIAAYDRAEFLPDRKKMMQEYADYIENLVKSTT